MNVEMMQFARDASDLALKDAASKVLPSFMFVHLKTTQELLSQDI